MERQQLLHFAIQSIPWTTGTTTAVELLVVGAKNQFMVLPTGVQEVDVRPTFIINHVRKYPLGCTIPCIHYILLFFFDEKTGYLEKEKSSCQVYNEPRKEYTYHCYRCDFNLHIKCTVAQLEAEFHDHSLTPFGKSITFTCDICGKEGKGVPNMCATCCFPRRLKAICHKHPLHVTHSSFEIRESDSQFYQLCVQKVDTRYRLYYSSKCDFVAHLNCAIDQGNRKYINLLELKDEENEDVELDQSVESAAAYKVKNIKAGETELK